MKQIINYRVCFLYIFFFITFCCKTVSHSIMIDYPNELFLQIIEKDTLLMPIPVDKKLKKKTDREIVFEKDVTQQVKEKIHFLSDINKNKKHKVFRILTYSGTNRTEAEKIYHLLASNVSKKIDIVYDQPNYKVKIGYYFTRLSSYEALKFIEKYYPHPILLKEYTYLSSDYID